MLRILTFVLVVNGLVSFALHVSELLFSVPELNFISDYFFYALLIQWSLSGLFLIAKPGKEPYLRHSPNPATRMAASIADEPKPMTVSQILMLALACCCFYLVRSVC